jgi:hypothetical protein
VDNRACLGNWTAFLPRWRVIPNFDRVRGSTYRDELLTSRLTMSSTIAVFLGIYCSNERPQPFLLHLVGR